MKPVIWIFALLFLPCAGCATSNAPVPAPAATAASAPAADLRQEPEKVQPNFEIHEWGVLVGCYTDDNYLNTSRPLEVPALPPRVREPVIYVHSKDKKPFSLRVTFESGKPTLTYPVAEISGNTVSWPSVQFGRPVQKMSTEPSSKQEVNLIPFNSTPPSVLKGYITGPVARAEYFDPLQWILPVLNDVDADELTYGGQTARFLFYEGEARFHNTITVDFNVRTKTATVYNSGSDTVYDVMIIIPPEAGYARIDFLKPIRERGPREKISVGRMQELKAGKKCSLRLSAVENEISFVPSLTALGFTDKEAVSFEKLWKGPFLRPADHAGSFNLIYRLSQEQCRTITELEFDPKPDKIVRALYILVRPSPRPSS